MSRRSAAARVAGTRYPTAIKLAIVRAVVVDGAKVAAVAEHRQISQALIYQWLKAHRAGKLPLPEPKPAPAKPKPPGSIADRQLSLVGQQPVTVAEPQPLDEQRPKPTLVVDVAEREAPPAELVVRRADTREAELLQLLAERDAKIAALTRTIRVLRQTVDGLLVTE